MLSAYLDIQVTFLFENTALHECQTLPGKKTFNSPFACQLETLLSLNILLELLFSISEMAGAICLVRVFDNQ